jgi:UDP-glucose 4-epimerase
MDRLIISGSTGYLGAYLTKYFRSKSFDVFTAGRRSDDIYFDFNSTPMFNTTGNLPKVDAFVHCAAANELLCREDAELALHYNVCGTRSALEFCVRNKVEKFVYISTFHVYGAEAGYIDETTCTAPITEYGLNHLLAEEYVKMYARLHQIEVLIVRPTNIFGIPTDMQQFNRWSPIPFSFCKEAVEDSQIQLLSNGLQIRNFVPLVSVADIILQGLNRKQMCQVLNAAGPDNISVRDFAYKVLGIFTDLTGRESKLLAPNCDAAISGNELKVGSVVEIAVESELDQYIRDFICILLGADNG